MSAANARDLELDLQWFRQVLDTRLKLHFGQETMHQSIFDISPPDLSTSDSNWAKLTGQHQLHTAERLILLLAIIPHIAPRLLDVLFTKNATFDRPFTEFGGHTNGADARFIPTIQTALFLLAGQDLQQRFAMMAYLLPEGKLQQNELLVLHTSTPEEWPESVVLRISKKYLALWTHGQALPPVFGRAFPAEAIHTTLEWSDLVLNSGTLQQIKEIETWIEHGSTLLEDWGMAGKIRPGFRALFYGPPGTGKTMTACLLGKTTGRDVYRIDLSMVVSKYIGETEKNLSRVFQQAEHQNWILFFDEADALFGKRSETTSAHDRYANQEVAYLLQRIESFNGLVVLASNFKHNIDDAFSRRFEAMVAFPVPDAAHRLRIWQQGFSQKATLAADINLDTIAKKFVLPGGAIMNVVRFASLEALRRGSNEIQLTSLRSGIRRELEKEGKLL